MRSTGAGKKNGTEKKDAEKNAPLPRHDPDLSRRDLRGGVRNSATEGLAAAIGFPTHVLMKGSEDDLQRELLLTRSTGSD